MSKTGLNVAEESLSPQEFATFKQRYPRVCTLLAGVAVQPTSLTDGVGPASNLRQLKDVLRELVNKLDLPTNGFTAAIARLKVIASDSEEMWDLMQAVSVAQIQLKE